MHPQKKALIVKFGQIGDVIMAIPAVYALHKEGYEIHWVCGRTIEPLLACYSWIHTLPVDDKAIFFGRPMKRAWSIARVWRRLALKRFDLCAILYYDSRYRLLTLPVRAKRTLMFSKDSRKFSLVPGRHHADEYARLVLGTEDGYLPQSIRLVRPDRLPISPVPETAAVRRVAMVPGGGSHLIREQASGRLPEQALRRWPIEHYVALAQQLVALGWEVLLLGGPEDCWAAKHFGEMQVLDWIGKLSLAEVIAVCDGCDAVVTHDTGPMHLAGMSEACLLGIFGPTNPATFLPRRPYSTGIWGGQDFACRPCYDGTGFALCSYNGCIAEVTPELVLEELNRSLIAKDGASLAPWRIVSPERNQTGDALQTPTFSIKTS